MRIVIQQEALYGYLKEVDISRDELARRMKVSTATAYRVTAGKTDPSPLFIASLMHVTGLPFEALFTIVREEAEPAA
jgi:transcriptional regulator with XRE-family HTH domain